MVGTEDGKDKDQKVFLPVRNLVRYNPEIDITIR